MTTREPFFTAQVVYVHTTVTDHITELATTTGLEINYTVAAGDNLIGGENKNIAFGSSVGLTVLACLIVLLITAMGVYFHRRKLISKLESARASAAAAYKEARNPAVNELARTFGPAASNNQADYDNSGTIATYDPLNLKIRPIPVFPVGNYHQFRDRNNSSRSGQQAATTNFKIRQQSRFLPVVPLQVLQRPPRFTPDVAGESDRTTLIQEFSSDMPAPLPHRYLGESSTDPPGMRYPSEDRIERIQEVSSSSSLSVNQEAHHGRSREGGNRHRTSQDQDRWGMARDLLEGKQPNP
jgi:hypothetical protein